jgi:site-specific recombinase XerC
MPERIDFLEGDEPAASKVAAFLSRALPATLSGPATTAEALVPWICDSLLSNHSVKAYGRDLVDFVRHMHAQGASVLDVKADHVKLYKRAMLEAGLTPTTVARRLSVLRGAFQQFAAKGMMPWEIAQDIAAVKAPPVKKNSTPALTSKQAVALLEAIAIRVNSMLSLISDLALLDRDDDDYTASAQTEAWYRQEIRRIS